MSKRHTSNCNRCGAVLQPMAEVCATCCAPQSEAVSQSVFTAPATPAVVAAPTAPADPTTGLGAWPFGQADAEAAAQVAAQAVAADVRSELNHYSAQTNTHHLSAIPTQRPAEQEPLQSVPSTGPNPFLAAARIQNAHDEAALVEGYPV